MPRCGTETMTLRCYEAGPDGQPTPATFANLFQEAASNNARELGFPGDRLWAEGMAWVLTRLGMGIHRYPAVGDPVTIRTWPSAHERSVAQRCYEALDAQGQTLAWGTSAWMVMDMQSRHALPVPTFVTEGYPKGQPPCQPFATRAVPKLRDESTACAAQIRTRRADMDMNGHTNNAHYAEWVMEPVPSHVCARYEPSMFDITFRAECGAGMDVQALCSFTEEHGADAASQVRESLHSLRLPDGTELCRARTLWRMRKD